MAVYYFRGKGSKIIFVFAILLKFLHATHNATCFLVITQESAQLKGGRGKASMVQKCKLCARENSIGMSGRYILTFHSLWLHLQK